MNIKKSAEQIYKHKGKELDPKTLLKLGMEGKKIKPAKKK